MKPTKEPIQKTVTIIYGNDVTERARILNQKIEGKNSCELYDRDVEGKDVTILKGPEINYDLYCCNGLAIDEFALIIESQQMKINRKKIITKPQFVFSMSSFSPADIEYFGKMEHVSLISCMQKPTK